MLKPGDELRGCYKVEKFLGQGAYGSVFQARHVLLDRFVAVKMLHPTADPAEWADLKRQFLEEARLLSQLGHPNLARVSDFFEDQHTAFMVMDYIDGENLEEVVQRDGPQPESRVLEWAQQICDVLQYLHQLSPPVVMRDLKPQNLMLSHERVHVLDFGIAKVGDSSVPTVTMLRFRGTPPFCPLEQYHGGTDQRSDYYALGATMLYLLTGNLPPNASERVTHHTPLPCPAGVSSGTRTAIDSLMGIRPEDRPGTVADVHHLLATAGSTPPVSRASGIHHPLPPPARTPTGQPSSQTAGSPAPPATAAPPTQPVPPHATVVAHIAPPLPPPTPARAPTPAAGPAAVTIRILAVLAVGGLLAWPHVAGTGPRPGPSQSPPGMASGEMATGSLKREQKEFPVQSAFTGSVTRVRSGDTIEVLHNGTHEAIRLPDIDSPETRQTFGDKARAETSRLALHKTVTVEVTRKDSYGRTLAYVTLPDGSDLSYALVGGGFAWHYTRYSKDARLARMHSDAKAQRRGLWADTDPTPPEEWRHTH